MRITPSIEDQPHVGDDMRITCEIIGSDQFNRPQWQTPEGAVVPFYQAGINQRMGVQYLTPTATNLVINNMQSSDAGLYTCTIGPLQGYFDIYVEEPETCDVICENMGQCFGSQCQCPESFSGSRCEIRSK